MPANQHTITFNDSIPEDEQKHLVQIIRNTFGKLRYGILWHQFDVDEIISYAQYKSKKANLILKAGDTKGAVDDLEDAVNHLLFAIDMISAYHQDK